MKKNLILTGGPSHPFPQSAPALARLLDEAGFASTVIEDLDEGFSRLSRSEFELLTVYALRWQMDEPRFEPQRARWQYRVGEPVRAAVRAHLAAGRGILALHTAALCFDDWPDWGRIVGAAWSWARSSHPPNGEVDARILPKDHPITRGLGDFTLPDEVYGDMTLQPDLVPLVEAGARSKPGWTHPALWARAIDGGRVVYDALGHDGTSLNEATHRRIVKRAALWAVAATDGELFRH